MQKREFEPKIRALFDRYNGGMPANFRTLDEVETIPTIGFSWVYYRPFGFTGIGMGSHEMMAWVLTSHLHGKYPENEDHFKLPIPGIDVNKGGFLEHLLEFAPFAYNSGVKAMGRSNEPFMNKELLTVREMLVLTRNVKIHHCDSPDDCLGC